MAGLTLTTNTCYKFRGSREETHTPRCITSVQLMMEPGYTVQEVARITDVSLRNIRCWSSPPAEIVIPAIAAPGVQRSPKLFSRRNLVQLAVVGRLSKRGVSVAVMSAAIRYDGPGWETLWDPAAGIMQVFCLVEGKAWHVLQYHHDGPLQKDEQFDALFRGVGSFLWDYGEVLVLDMTRIKDTIFNEL